jgi:hypothetical protein
MTYAPKGATGIINNKNQNVSLQVDSYAAVTKNC